MWVDDSYRGSGIRNEERDKAKLKLNSRIAVDIGQAQFNWTTQKELSTGEPDCRLFTFFSRLAQAGKKCKQTAVWFSCT